MNGFKFGINWNWVISLICAFILGLTFSYTANAVTLLTVPQGGTGAGTFTSGECLVGNGTGAVTTVACGGGYTNLTSFVNQTAWRVFYSDSLGDVTELALGTSGQYLKSTGATGAPTWDTPGGSGDMLKSVYDTDADNMVDTAEDLTCTDCINATEIEDIYILKTGYSTGALTSDLNIDSNSFVVSYDDNKIGLGTATPAYKLDVVGSIQTDTAFRGDTWVSATGNSMAIQPTGDVDDYFSFKTPTDRPTIKREGGKYIYIESSNVNDVGLSFRKDADHSGTLNYYKDENLFGMTSKDPLVFKVCEDYDDYVKVCAADNVPEMSTVGAADFKINAGGSNALLLNHAGGNVAVGATSTNYVLGLGTGDTFGIGATQWNYDDKIDGAKIKDANYGDVVIDAEGDWHVSEATALASNGANCNAGYYPLGVDASGAVESCTLASGGYTNLTSFVDQTAWRVFYSDSLGDVTELALGTSGQYLKSTGATGAPTWDTPGGSGDMLKSVYDTNSDDVVDTATALAANGVNCAVGHYPRGVNASGAVESCTADTNTTYTAGRSLTLDGTTINADSELYHHEKCLYFEDPVAADDFKSLFHFRKAATITGMWCESDQTVNMDLQLDDGTPADINGTDLVCDSTPADDTSLGGDTGAGAGERLDLAITSVSGTPTWVSICFNFTYDD